MNDDLFHGRGGSRLRGWARRMMTETYALCLAIRDPRTPWYAKAWGALVAAYAASPIDLIPDFIPVLGYLDDLLLVPLGIALAIRMIPREVWRECRSTAQQACAISRPWQRAVMAAVICVWLVILAWLAFLLWRAVQPGRQKG